MQKQLNFLGLLIGVMALCLAWPGQFVVNAAPPAVAPGLFEEGSCPTTLLSLQQTSGNVTCGQLTVPEEHAKPEGSTIKLDVVIIHSSAASPAKEPLVMLQGGPGGSTIDVYGMILSGENPVKANRDIVLFDQRGTMYASPFLNCPEVLALTESTLDQVLSPEEELKQSIEAEMACHARLEEEGVNLAAYNSLENAADIEALRLALGYEKINLYGVSYGTLLAQHFMRNFPNSLQSVILDAVVPTETNFVTQVPQTMNRAHQALFEACTADPACNEGYPDLEKSFFSAVEKLNQKPGSFSLTDPDTGRTYRNSLNGDDLVETTFQLLYSAEILPMLPKIIHDAEQGNFDILSIIMPMFVFDRTMSDGMYNSVMCAEDADYTPADVATAGIRQEFVKTNVIQAEAFLALCKQWDVPELGPAMDAPVASDIPTLLLSGRFDPITPSPFADKVAANLSRHYAFTFPNTGHGAFVSNECANTIVADFLNHPATGPDASCLTGEAPVSFLGPDEIITTPVMYRVAELFEGHRLVQAAILGLCLFFLLSAMIIWPAVWLIRLILNKKSANTPRWSWAAALTAWLTGGNNLIFLLGIVGMVFTVGMSNEMILVVGMPKLWGLLFLLPLAAIPLTIGMVAFSGLSWKTQKWSLWRRVYYTLLTLSALIMLVGFGWWGVLSVLW